MPNSSITSFFTPASSKRRRLDAPSTSSSTPTIDQQAQPPPVVLISESPPRPASTASIEQGDSTVNPASEPGVTRPCSLECCNLSKHEPTRLGFVKADTVREYGQTGKRKRYYREEWQDMHSWLVLCKTRNKAFCQNCRYALHLGLININGLSDIDKGNTCTLAKSGFNDWKDGAQTLREHEQSKCQYLKSVENKVEGMDVYLKEKHYLS